MPKGSHSNTYNGSEGTNDHKQLLNIGTKNHEQIDADLDFHLMDQKISLDDGDWFVVEDSMDLFRKKKVKTQVMTGVTIHDELDGLADDDHLQYHNDARGDARYIRGPASASDNAIARFDSTSGKLAKNSNVTIDDAGNVVSPAAIMWQYTYASSDGESTTTGTWGAKVTTTPTLVAGTYKIEWYYEIRSSVITTDTGARLQDTTTPATLAETTSDRSVYGCGGGVYVAAFAAGARTFEIQFQRNSGGGTSYIRHARIFITRVA